MSLRRPNTETSLRARRCRASDSLGSSDPNASVVPPYIRPMDGRRSADSLRERCEGRRDRASSMSRCCRPHRTGSRSRPVAASRDPGRENTAADVRAKGGGAALLRLRRAVPVDRFPLRRRPKHNPDAEFVAFSALCGKLNVLYVKPCGLGWCTLNTAPKGSINTAFSENGVSNASNRLPPSCAQRCAVSAASGT